MQKQLSLSPVEFAFVSDLGEAKEIKKQKPSRASLNNEEESCRSRSQIPFSRWMGPSLISLFLNTQDQILSQYKGTQSHWLICSQPDILTHFENLTCACLSVKKYPDTHQLQAWVIFWVCSNTKQDMQYAAITVKSEYSSRQGAKVLLCECHTASWWMYYRHTAVSTYL